MQNHQKFNKRFQFDARQMALSSNSVWVIVWQSQSDFQVPASVSIYDLAQSNNGHFWEFRPFLWKTYEQFKHSNDFWGGENVLITFNSEMDLIPIKDII